MQEEPGSRYRGYRLPGSSRVDQEWIVLTGAM